MGLLVGVGVLVDLDQLESAVVEVLGNPVCRHQRVRVCVFGHSLLRSSPGRENRPLLLSQINPTEEVGVSDYAPARSASATSYPRAPRKNSIEPSTSCSQVLTPLARARSSSSLASAGWKKSQLRLNHGRASILPMLVSEMTTLPQS